MEQKFIQKGKRHDSLIESLNAIGYSCYGVWKNGKNMYVNVAKKLGVRTPNSFIFDTQSYVITLKHVEHRYATKYTVSSDIFLVEFKKKC